MPEEFTESEEGPGKGGLFSRLRGMFRGPDDDDAMAAEA